MPLPANSDLWSTSEEAERFLAEFTGEPAEQVPEDVPVEPGTQGSESTPSAPPARQTPPFGLVLVPFALMIGLMASWHHQASSPPPPSPSSAQPQEDLMFRRSCGSTSSTSGQWWPVLADPDRSLLAAVRNRYCGDAYINANGMPQVASFNNPQQAEQLAERLSAATGSTFRRGEGYAP